MAGSYQQGYDERRFADPVRADLFCSICQCVLREPRTCRNREHPFCLSCISQHLRNSHTCPECREDLTPETLKTPRFLKNILSELKIKCEFIERGCLGYVLLGDLQNHTEKCDFAPAMCANEKCRMILNRRDKDLHENELCQFRIAKGHDYKNVKENVDDMKATQNELRANQDEIKASQCKMKASQNQMKASQDEMKSTLNQLKSNQDRMKSTQNQLRANQNEMRAAQNQLRKKQGDMMANQDEIKASQYRTKGEWNATKVQIVKMDRKQDEISVKVNQIQENVERLKRTQAELKADQVMFNTEVREQFKTVTDMLNELLQARNVNNSGVQATLETTLAAKPVDNNQDIIILGGSCGFRKEEIFDTVEKFNIADGKSTELPPMKKPRTESASCVYNGDVIVTGGLNGQDVHDTIEILNMNQQPLQWKMFRRKLPFKLYSHTVTVHHNNMYVVGGHNRNENKTSDEIHELSLTPPYTAKLLARMPQARRYHRTEIVNEKLFIFGGTTTVHGKDALDNVVVYDFITKEFNTCPSLPTAICRMSTVTWGNTIIVIDGLNKNNQILNDVIMYDTETGRSERLPSLRHKRYGSSAVILDEVIVVLGGRNAVQGHLNSVESFTMGSDGWKELPGMREKRDFATAVVKPSLYSAAMV